MVFSEAYENFKALYLLSHNRSEKTFKEYAVRFTGRNGFLTIIGDVPVELINQVMVLKWKLHLRDEGISPGYINDYISSLKTFLRWLRQEETKVIDPLLIPWETEEVGKPHNVLSEDEMERVIRATTNQRDGAVTRLVYSTACRISEILNLNRRQWESLQLVYPTQGIYELWVLGKNKKYRPVNLTQEAKNAVDRYIATRNDCFDPLFISGQNRRLSYQTYNRALHKAAAAANINKDARPHDLRHSMTSELAANGAPIPAISQLLGHSNSAVTQKVYTHINKSQASEAYARFHTHND